jgi:hypothetical protein
MADRIRFAAPVYHGGRICLLSGSVTMGAVFPPVTTRQPWRWRLFQFGANPPRDGEAKDAATAKGHLLSALALTLAEAGLAPIPVDDSAAGETDSNDAGSTP